MKSCVILICACLIAAILLLASCAQPRTTTTAPTATAPTTATPTATSPVTTKPAEEVPQYGGTLTLAIGADIGQWDPNRIITGTVVNLYGQSLWEGDWSKGNAGGYGTKETDWGFGNNDIFDLKMGFIAESWKWTVDAAQKEGTIVYQIRKGVKWALNPNSEASRLVNGREVTADDVVFSCIRSTTLPVAFVFSVNPELRNVPVTKTGPREVTIKVPYDALYTAITRFGSAVFIVPPEVVSRYGDLSGWRNQVGTGPFMISDYVPAGSVTAIRNPNYWMTDPVGPGKGNQLPYLDSVKVLIIPDLSTRYAALRVGKIDQFAPIAEDDAADLRRTATGIIEIVSPNWQGRGTPMFMRTDRAPFNDIRVRKAMNMAIDRATILKDFYRGKGEVFPYPFAYVKEYDPMYYKQEDWTPEIKEIYTYNPEKAKQLLKEAGYPAGFKTELLITSPEVDYYSIVMEMLSKIGVQVEFMIRDVGVRDAMHLAWTHPPLTAMTSGPVAVFMVGNMFAGVRFNLSILDDPVINDYLKKVRTAAITDLKEAMRIYREMTKYALAQAYHVPNVNGSVSLMYWPWIKNYSGEISVGYDDMNWPQWVWLDQKLKKSMTGR